MPNHVALSLPQRQLIAAAYNKIIDNPHMHDQRHWHCGTGHCFAGWIDICAGYWDTSENVITRAGAEATLSHAGSRKVLAPSLTVPENEIFLDAVRDALKGLDADAPLTLPIWEAIADKTVAAVEAADPGADNWNLRDRLLLTPTRPHPRNPFVRYTSVRATAAAGLDCMDETIVDPEPGEIPFDLFDGDLTLKRLYWAVRNLLADNFNSDGSTRRELFDINDGPQRIDIPWI